MAGSWLQEASEPSREAFWNVFVSASLCPVVCVLHVFAGTMGLGKFDLPGPILNLAIKRKKSPAVVLGCNHSGVV